MAWILRPIDRLILWIGRMVFLFVALSVGWVLFHAVVPPSSTLTMGLRAQAGAEIKTDWISLEEMSPHLIRAVIASEDSKFCSHRGFDVEQIKAALAEAENGNGLRGASTISQQTAKNVFLWPGRGWVRKGFEAWFTALIEVFWGKERILEAYLNVAEWGDGYFGAEATAQGRFGKPAAGLNAAEASLMATVLPNPHKWRVSPPGPYVSRRSYTVRKRMAVVRQQALDACVAE